MAVDAILGRLTILSARDARAVRTLPLPGGVRFDRYLMCEQGEHLIVLVDRPRRLGERGKVTRFPAALVRVAVGSATQETLGELPGTDYYFASRVDGYVDVPLGARAAAAANGRHVYFAQTDHAMVQVIELESGRRRSFAHGLARPDVSPAAWDAATEARVDIEPLTRTRELLRRVLEEVPMPEQQPPFVDMKVDRAGRLWLRLPSLGASATWRVLNPTGRHVGTVLLPSNVEPLDIGNRHVVAVARDSMGVQSVLVYSFSRPLLSQ